MKTKLFLVLACLILTVTCVFALSSCNDECLHENKGEIIDEIPATCTEDGVIAHYICADCGALLNSELQVVETTVIEKTGHIPGALAVKVEPTCTEDGAIAHYTCEDCGVLLDSELQVVETTVIEKTGHVHGSSKVEAKPTCTDEGKSVVKCTLCDEILSTESIPATGHDFTEMLAIGPNDCICVNGALIIKTCSDCGHKETANLPANADEGADSYHKVEKWTLLIAPTYTDSGLMEGKCTNKHCQESVTYTLPCINSEFYTMTSTLPDVPCSSDFTVTFEFLGESYFSYEITENGETKTVDKLSFDVTLKKYNHVLNGVEMNAESYDRDIEGIEYCPNCPECTIKETQGYYVCDVCGDLIYILINDKHTVSEDNWIITVAPGCETEGERQAVCEVEGCEAIITETIPALGHDFSYTLGYAEDGKSYVLNGICKTEGCEAVAVHENVKGVTIEAFAPTCKCAGLTVHKLIFAECGVDYSTSDVSVEFSTEVAQLDHTVDGVKLTENGTYNLSDYPSLEKYASSLVTCSADVAATVSCSVCKRNDITVMLHKDHTSLTVLVAGCEDSIATLTCKFCEVEYYVELSGTGHSIEKYTVIEASEEEGMYYVGGFCSKCCAEGETVWEVNPVALTVTETKGSCQTAGSVTYSLNGEVIHSYETEKSCHVLGGVDMSSSHDVVYSTNDYPGIKPFGNAVIDSCTEPSDAYFICDVCQEVVSVKAVLGHSASEWTTTVLPTCDTDGVKVGSCDSCGAQLEDSIPALGHTYEYDFTLSTKTLIGSCTVEGCEHSYSLTRTKRVIIESSCTENGSTTYTGLDADGVEKTVVIELPLIPHSIEGITVNELGAYEITTDKVGALANTNATCGSIVEGYYVCDGCGQHIHVNVYQPHVSVSEDDAITVAPTCTENGTKTFPCSLCSEVVTVESIPALGHSYTVSISTLPTEETAGEAIGVCECGFKTEFALPVLSAENYEAPKVIRETSCLDDGIYLYSYTINDGEKSYPIDFEIITSKFVYNDSCETSQLEVEEEVTFTDPFGEIITVKVVVSYVYFECPGENCDINILHSKSFVYDENLFVYDFELEEYNISLPEGEK